MLKGDAKRGKKKCTDCTTTLASQETSVVQEAMRMAGYEYNPNLFQKNTMSRERAEAKAEKLNYMEQALA